MTDINQAGAVATCETIRAQGGKAFTLPLDVRDRQACMSAASEIAQRIGDVSVLVNNAGVCPRHTIDSPDLESQWELAMSVNLDGVLNVTLAFLAALRRSKGAIINIASIASFVSTATSVSYPVSKAGVRALTQSLAHELAKDGVRVNAIAPGPFATEMTEATRFDATRSERFLTRIPMGRFGEPEELVGPVAFLASEMSSCVTGCRRRLSRLVIGRVDERSNGRS